ncbi:MAG: SIS domain-containing protein [Deltaproteobacteria bacterium]|nr:SIS domain-containing protein [Deltaproteobacteria bacterium]
MCGIAGFLSNEAWKNDLDLNWVYKISDSLTKLQAGSFEIRQLREAIDGVIGKFDEMMRFSFHFALSVKPDFFSEVDNLANLLEKLLNKISDQAGTEEVECLRQDIGDTIWQIRAEVLKNVSRTNELINPVLSEKAPNRHQRFVAWSIEKVLENIDRLEVRGRDSAGISVQLIIVNDKIMTQLTELDWFATRRSKVANGVKIDFAGIKLDQQRFVVTFVFKVANLVGHLGDNTRHIRKAVGEDDDLWMVAAFAKKVSILAHTRWASNGIISLSNCHPVNGELYEKEHFESIGDRDSQFVLNGDVDNFNPLVTNVVHSRGYKIDPTVTTDAKILPVFFRLGTSLSEIYFKRFAELMNSCEGSLAVVMQHPQFPEDLVLGQKGSGQSLFIGQPSDGFILASEVYGLAAWTRSCLPLSGLEKGGTEVVISTKSGDKIQAYFLEDVSEFKIKTEPIYIHSRDIFRGDFKYYFEKEIHEAPSSIRKTIRGKYIKQGRTVNFIDGGHGTFGALINRLRDTNQPRIRRIVVIGQGTASIAAKGVAYLVEKPLEGLGITVSAYKASELSGFMPDRSMNDTLLIAISQSGTTTDTNRTVDIASSQGAWVHSIVNRRNSPLVAKSNSHFYTSDGRDVEMAVASTKAFYSQVAAGKLTAVLLAKEFNAISDENIYHEIKSLEELPRLIESVLKQNDSIRSLAELYGPSSRNWAVVGNGPNKIAADEIRIKLSELCYKSIPCDFTEDKKHIDLSTEPLTLVIANDLPEQIVQDTAKEVAIFKAHSGRPLVFCAQGEKRFVDHAESVIELPEVGGDLGFVIATVAGHLWGFHTARAIDSQANRLRDIRSLLTRFMENPLTWDFVELQNRLNSVLKMISNGEMNAALPASTAAALAVYSAKFLVCDEVFDDREILINEGIVILSKAIEEMTRPIDSIRHQAKTVTVGISRPQDSIPSSLLKALEALGVQPGWVKEQDKRVFKALSQVIEEVIGGMLYRVGNQLTPDEPAGEFSTIQAVARFGFSEGKTSRYDIPNPAGGSKRTALRLRRVVLSSGKAGQESLLVAPLFSDDSGECKNLALLHVQFAKQASVSQKINVLKALGGRYHEVVEKLEEQASSCSIEDFVQRVAPRDLVLAPVESLIISISC